MVVVILVCPGAMSVDYWLKITASALQKITFTVNLSRAWCASFLSWRLSKSAPLERPPGTQVDTVSRCAIPFVSLYKEATAT